jgi:uncharacterized cupin superfamily protein
MSRELPAAARVRLLAPQAGEGESYFVAVDKLIAGNPKQTAWVQHASPDQRFTAGLWHSEAGTWRIRYTEDEYCRILEGLSIITAEDGQAVSVRPGDEFVIPRGFVGTWEVVEPTLKRFVIHEADR